MDLSKLTKPELFKLCEDLNLSKYKSKKKSELIELINSNRLVPGDIASIHPVQLPGNNRFSLVDLFAGTGAFSLAFHTTNKVHTIFANDIVDSSEKIFNLNNDLKLTKKDINGLDDSEIPVSHILTAGFACQPFSIAGIQKGFDDVRSNVFWKILSILKTNLPEVVILENVKNLQSHDNGNSFKIIIQGLETLGYNIKHAILNTCKITGIPQNRERIYIVCFKNRNLYDKFDLEFPELPIKPISNFLETNVPDKYYYNASTIIYDELQKNIVKHVSTNTIYQYRRYYVRDNKNNVCPTLTANMGTGGHNVPLILDDKGIRKLTPRECFNLQGFPADYKLPNISPCKLYSLAGNAVSVPVVSLIAERIVGLLLQS